MSRRFCAIRKSGCADSAAVDAAYRASGMLSLTALTAVDHAPGARVLAVGQFEVGVVAVVQRGPNWWDLVIGGVVHRFEDAAGALAAQGLSALIAVGGPGAQHLVRAAGQDLGRILKDPGAFFAHLAAALGEGFRLFARDLGGNLERGALQWLTGQGGLTLPSPDPAGLLTFALETAGVSYAAFTGDLQAAFTKRHRDGSRLVAQLDTLYGYAPALHDLATGPGGPAGQLAALAGHLISEVKSLNVQALVFAQLTAVLGPQLLLRVAPTLLGYLIPGADVAEAVGAVVRLVGVVTDQAAGLAALGTTVFDALDMIVRGKESDLTAAAEKINTALQRAAPVVLALAASVVGVDLAHIGGAILDRLHAKEVAALLHKGLAELADAVADVLLKAVPPAVLARLEGHAAPEPSHTSPAPAHHGGAPTSSDAAAGHDLDAVLAAAVTAVDARVAASPTTPLSEEEVRAVLTRVHAAHHEAEAYTLTPVADGTHWAVRGVMVVPATPTTAQTPPHHGHPHAGTQDVGTQDVGTQDAALALDGAGPAARGDEVGLVSPDAVWTVRAGTRTATGEQELTRQRGTEALVKVVDGRAAPRTVIQHAADNSHVVAAPLTKAPPALSVGGVTRELVGSRPGADPPGWDDVLAFDDIYESEDSSSWQPRHWVLMHLLSERLHGPGEPWNTVPADKKVNGDMANGPEAQARKALDEGIPALYYETTVTFHKSGENPLYGRDTKAVDWAHFPEAVTVTVATAKQDDRGKWVKDKDLKPPYVFDQLRLPNQKRQRSIMVDLLRAGATEYRRVLNLTTEWEGRVFARYAPYKDEDDFKAKLTAHYQRDNPPVDFMAVYWPRVQAAIDQKKAEFLPADI